VIVYRFFFFFLKFEQRVLQFLGFKFLTEAIMKFAVLWDWHRGVWWKCTDVSKHWTIGTSERRNIPEDEIYIDGCFITLLGWQLSVVHSMRNTGFVQMGTTVTKYVLSVLKFAVLNFDRPCASTEYWVSLLICVTVR